MIRKGTVGTVFIERRTGSPLPGDCYAARLHIRTIAVRPEVRRWPTAGSVLRGARREVD